MIPDGLQESIAVFSWMLLILILVYIANRLNNSTVILAGDDEKVDLYDQWISTFKDEQLKTASRGDKALANPFDESPIGIPNNYQLEILKNRIIGMGFGAHINTSSNFSGGLHHLTVYWD